MEIQIHPLQSHHDIDAFTCGTAALDSWLRCTAKQHGRKGISRSYVAVEADNQQRVIGFYSLTVGEAETGVLPSVVAKTLPRKIPIVLIGRLAVTTQAQGQGIGGILLVDALKRTVRVSSEVGISAILVDAKDQKAAEFYQHYGFLALPDLANHLVLPIKTAVDLFAE